jgi:hypothetical protein
MPPRRSALTALVALAGLHVHHGLTFYFFILFFVCVGI